MASGRLAGSRPSIEVAGGRISVALYLRPSGFRQAGWQQDFKTLET